MTNKIKHLRNISQKMISHHMEIMDIMLTNKTELIDDDTRYLEAYEGILRSNIATTCEILVKLIKTDMPSDIMNDVIEELRLTAECLRDN